MHTKEKSLDKQDTEAVSVATQESDPLPKLIHSTGQVRLAAIVSRWQQCRPD